MVKCQSLSAVAIACLLLGLIFEASAVGVECAPGSKEKEPKKPGNLKSGKIPPGYTNYPGIGTYKFHAYGATWDEAKKGCEKEGAKMLVVNSRAESSVIVSMFLFKFSTGVESILHVWVGVKEYGTNGKFFTNDGQPVEETGFNSWGILPQQPNDPGDNDCATFTALNVLYDDPCDLKYAFVCELS